MMIESIVDRLKRGFHIREVHYPTAVRIHITGNVQLDAKRMAMQARALVPSRNIGQAMGRLDSEDAEDVHENTVGIS